MFRTGNAGCPACKDAGVPKGWLALVTGGPIMPLT